MNYRDQRQAAELYSTLDPPSIRRLEELGVLEAGHTGPNKAICLAAWQAFVVRRACRPDAAEERLAYKDYKFIRKVLGASGLPHCQAMLRSVGHEAKGRTISSDWLQAAIGKVTAAEVNIVRMAGGEAPRKVVGPQRSASIEELLALFDPPLANLLRDWLSEEKIPAIVPPIANHIARVLAFPKPWRKLGALALVRLAYKRRALQTAGIYVTAFEHVITHLDGVDPAEWGSELETFVSERHKVPQKLETRRGWFSVFAMQMVGAKSWTVKKARPHSIAVTLPDLRWLKAANDALSKAGDVDVDEAASVNVEDPSPPSKLERVTNRLLNSDEVATLVSFRVMSVRTLAAAYQASVAKMKEHDLREMPFDIHVGIGKAMVRSKFRVVRADLAWEIVLRQPGHYSALRRAYQKLLDRQVANVAKGTPEFICIFDEPYHSLETTTPFFVDFYRFCWLDPMRQLSEGDRMLAAARRKELKFKAPSYRLPNVFNGPTHLSSLATALRGADVRTGQIVIPVLELEAGILQANLALELSKECSPRGFELLQLAWGPEYISSSITGSHELSHFKCHTKSGRRKKVAKQFGEDTGVLIEELVETLHPLLSPTAFTPMGQPSLNSVMFRASPEPHLRQRQPYLFQNGKVGLSVKNLNLIVRVLLSGIAESRFHEERSLTATRVALVTRDRRLVEKLLGHGADSGVTGTYDLSAKILALCRAREFAAKDAS